jgi:hypothetical protein
MGVSIEPPYCTVNRTRRLAFNIVRAKTPALGSRCRGCRASIHVDDGEDCCEADNLLDYGMTWSEGPFYVPLNAEGPELQS